MLMCSLPGRTRERTPAEACKVQCVGRSQSMNSLLKHTAAVFCTIFFAAASLSFAGSKASKGSTEGTFAGIEQGDYAHFLIKDKKGQRESFFILRPDRSVQSYLDNGDELKGRKVRVFWEERNENIPEAGGKQQIKVVTKVEART
jgi:hypothetical protein